MADVAQVGLEAIVASASACTRASRRAGAEFDLKEAAWRERLGLDEPVAVELLSVTRTLEEARRLGYLVSNGGARSSWLENQWWRDCDERRAPYVVVTVGRGRYAGV